ncbi:MAG TPA: thiopeptide-type bacteriocin biosynthesis protein, partial [Bacteroidia bacterium]|nr:thiopeptide-type bacteriocin biosynthesis protein [Bacteroidia bacterium]
ENDFEFSLPATFYSMFKIISENGQEKILLEATGGTSAANIIGRFAYASDELKQVLSDINQFEEEKYKGAIVAEIIHLPENRTGNILFRPVFRKHEIPYLAKPSVTNNFQVAISDLFISIINGRIVLRSQSLNKEIIPRLSNAHNYSFNSLPLYNFLCDLQAQQLNPALNFSWGALAFAFNFLPRVEHNDIIISPAKWKFSKDNYKELIKSNETNLFEDLKKWRAGWNLPDRIIIAEADNELLVDFNDKSQCELFLSILKKRDYIDLSECLVSQNSSENIVKDNKGQFYTHQFLSFIFNEDYRFEPVLFSNTQNEPERTFSIGSSWIYFKFYCGTKTADRILIETILPLTDMLMQNKWIEKWFFIRYWDPENHLRVRFYVPEFNNYLPVIDCVKNYFEKYQKSGLIWKIQLDTYQREIERYNCDNIENSESIFFIDSCNTLQFLTLIEGPEGEEIKLLFGIRLIDDLLNGFDFSIDKKILIMDQMKTSFTKEFRIDKNLKIQLDDKYRKLRKKIEDFFNDKTLEENLPEVYSLLIEKRSQLMPIIYKISGLFDSKTGSKKIEEVIFSYIHMSMNRLFSSKQRVSEMLIYYLVHKHYGSQRAILNRRKIPDEIPAL